MAFDLRRAGLPVIGTSDFMKRQGEEELRKVLQGKPRFPSFPPSLSD